MTTAYRNTKLARPLRRAEVLATGDNPEPSISSRQIKAATAAVRHGPGGMMCVGHGSGRSREAKVFHAYTLWMAHKEGRLIGPSLDAVLRDWGKQFARFDAGKDLPKGERYRKPKGMA